MNAIWFGLVFALFCTKGFEVTSTATGKESNLARLIQMQCSFRENLNPDIHMDVITPMTRYSPTVAASPAGQ